MLRLYILFLVLFIDVNASCSQKLILKDRLTIGNDESKGSEYLFSRPSFAMYDQDGRIYIADQTSMNIRVYSHGGEYITSYGSRGRAPGEFQAITSFTIDSDNTIVVLDGRSSRFTRFDTDGSVIMTGRIDRMSLLWPRQLIHFEPDDSYIVLSKMPVHANRSIANSSNVIHIYDRDFDKKTGITGRIENLVSYSAIPFPMAILESHPGSYTVTDNNLILYSPGLYEGTIYEFGKQNSQWTLLGSLASDVITEPSFELLTSIGDESLAGAITINNVTYDEPAVGRVNIQSAGLFSTSPSTVLHFVYVSEGQSGSLIYEQYDLRDHSMTSGTLLSNLRRNWFSRPLIQITDRSAHGEYLAIDITSEYPVVRVFTFEEK